MQKIPEVPDRKSGDAYAGKRKRFALTWAETLRRKDFLPLYHLQVAHMFCQVSGLRIWVVSAASEPTLRNKQRENTTGHDYTEYELINHRRRLTYFNAWFGEM